MAWFCSGATNVELVNNLVRAGIIRTPAVASAMKCVDRKFYVREKDRAFAYDDSPQSIGYGATISAPHMHGHAADHLFSYLKPGAKVLDVGSGSGYLIALFWHILRQKELKEEGLIPDRRIIGVDHVKQLTDLSIQNLKNDGLGENLDTEDEVRSIKMVTADGRSGYPAEMPYDVIHVGAAVPTQPEVLIEQLANGGRLFVPVESEYGNQDIILYDKDAHGKVQRKKLMGVSYVPLTDLKDQHVY